MSAVSGLLRIAAGDPPADPQADTVAVARALLAAAAEEIETLEQVKAAADIVRDRLARGSRVSGVNAADLHFASRRADAARARRADGA